MINENSIFRKVFFILVIILLTTPLICTFIPETKGDVLYGEVKSEFTLQFFKSKQFFDNHFQDEVEAASRKNVGSANIWVRLNN